MIIVIIVCTCLLLSIALTASDKYKIIHQVTGGVETNCYLLYDIKSKEAALIDIGGSIDSLISVIKSNNLDLKYLLCTHGHTDHVLGIPEVKKLYPNAKIVLSKSDYIDLFAVKEWADKNLGPEFQNYMRSNPAMRKIYYFDANSLGEPDIYTEDILFLPFGDSEINVFHTPGHSPGSVCYQIENIIFSGDLIFCRRAGRTDFMNGSRAELVKSFKKIYDLFQDNMIVYPGHDKFTDLDSEKKENKSVSLMVASGDNKQL